MGRVITMRPIIVFFITIIAKKTEVLNPFTKIHGQFTGIYVTREIVEWGSANAFLGTLCFIMSIQEICVK